MVNYNFVFVAIGGFLGAGLRYVISIIFHYPTPILATFIVNILGCLLIGLVFGLTQKDQSNKWIWPFWGTGFCGGFTTMSTFSMEIVHLWKTGGFTTLGFYIIATLLMGIGSTALGIRLATLFIQKRKKRVAS